VRLGIAGIHVECSTFSPLLTDERDFLATRGDEMLTRYPFLSNSEFAGIDPVPLAHFRAIPGGPVRRIVYESMKGEILDRLRKTRDLDAFYVDVHGAMVVEGLADAEADLLTAIRKDLPAEMSVTCSGDLHGNVSADFVKRVDLVTAYRTAPHLDVLETRTRAVRLLLRWRREGQPIYRAWVGIPILVSGEMSNTESEPGRSLYASLTKESEQPGVWDASLWTGYAWADEPRATAAAVVCGSDGEAVSARAKEIALTTWNARREFRFISPAGSADWCIEEALRLGGLAVFCSDAGDNPTAGAAGDVPATLETLLSHASFAAGGGSTAIFASLPDAAAVSDCASAGVGSTIRLRVGGKLDPVHGTPLKITAVVENVIDDDPIAHRQVVVRAGGVRVVLTTRRKPFHKRDDFLALGLDPLEHNVTVVKIGYLEPELKAMARHHLLVLSPGAVHPQISALPFRRITRPIFPLDEEFDWAPSVQVFRSAHHQA